LTRLGTIASGVDAPSTVSQHTIDPSGGRTAALRSDINRRHPPNMGVAIQHSAMTSVPACRREVLRQRRYRRGRTERGGRRSRLQRLHHGRLFLLSCTRLARCSILCRAATSSANPRPRHPSRVIPDGDVTPIDLVGSHLTRAVRCSICPPVGRSRGVSPALQPAAAMILTKRVPRYRNFLASTHCRTDFPGERDNPRDCRRLG